MFCNSGIFHCDHKELSNECYLHIVNFENIGTKLESHIDSVIVSICEGSTSTSLATIKKRLIDYLNTKSPNIAMGAVAEFFTHLYLKDCGFKQEFLYLNLEERSIKKGFDGYYSYDNDEWIYESKSGLITSKGISHKNKIKEACCDLENKVTGGAKNNPWQNAYNHASQIDVNCTQSIRQNIKLLSDDYTNKKFKEIIDFNIIPGSTIFLDSNWAADLKLSDVENELKTLISIKKV